MTAIGGHHSAAMKSDVWLTPPHVLAALGEFDLDPCAAPHPRPWEVARRSIALPDDGLAEPWDDWTTSEGLLCRCVCHASPTTDGQNVGARSVKSGKKLTRQSSPQELPAGRATSLPGVGHASAHTPEKSWPSDGQILTPPTLSERPEDDIELRLKDENGGVDDKRSTTLSGGSDSHQHRALSPSINGAVSSSGVTVDAATAAVNPSLSRSTTSSPSAPSTIQEQSQATSCLPADHATEAKVPAGSKSGDQNSCSTCNGCVISHHNRVFLNPPYSTEARRWLKQLAQHGRGTALVFARTETGWFVETVWRRASALLFLDGRITFHHADGARAGANSGAPSVLVAYGRDDALALARCGLKGSLVMGWSAT